MRKRGRAAGSEPAECPVCLEKFEARGERTEVKPFQCGHCVCTTCHARLIDEQDHRCPQCRAPRRGLTAQEAEPNPNRNHPLPTFAEALADLGHDISQSPFAQALLTGAAGGYGGRPMRGRTTTIFFPVQPPVSLGPPQARVPPDLLGTGMEARDVHTLLSFGAASGYAVPSLDALPQAVRDLLNIPEVALAEWNLVHLAGRRPSAPRTASRAHASARRSTQRSAGSSAARARSSE